MENKTLEDQIKTLQVHFGRVVSTVKYLQKSVDDLKLKLVEIGKKEEIKEVLETQRVVEEVIVANSDAIHQIKMEILKIKEGGKPRGKHNENTVKENDSKDDGIREVVRKQQEMDNDILKHSNVVKKLEEEIKSILKDKSNKDESKKEMDDAIKRLEIEILKFKKSENDFKSTKEILKASDEEKEAHKCRYFNVGYCKYKEKCRFTHPEEICKEYVEGECKGFSCPSRHPKACKWFRGSTGCRRKEECHFSHDKIICSREKNDKIKSYKCVSCDYEWNESHCVVKHVVQNKEVYFCLNCEDWVKEKSRVLDKGWSLFDTAGNINHFV